MAHGKSLEMRKIQPRVRYALDEEDNPIVSDPGRWYWRTLATRNKPSPNLPKRRIRRSFG